MEPLVTIGVPFYNSQDYIIETLNSIKSQTYPNIQLILVNDCSTDESLSLVKEWLIYNSSVFSGVALMENSQNKGTSFSCKIMEEAADGVFFNKVDADDVIHPHKISIQVKYLMEHPEVALVYSNTWLIDNSGQLLEQDYFTAQKFLFVINNSGPSGHVFNKLIVEDFIPNSSVLVRKNIIDEVGGYDETLFTEDWDLWLRICKKHPISFMEGYFSSYRIHPHSVMRKNSSLAKMYLSCCKAVFKHRNINKEFDRIIAKHINTYTIGMYRLGMINIEFLRTNFMYNRTLKSGLYYSFGLLKLKLNQKK